ncbi:CAP domain-containing protein [Bacillus andreraoultii]|uniref:CAP domain-containing protein n=1 Tax=Bacillus andreraoultii TaxID=1499685 RepID=UPI00053B9BE5|nr:CAP domain-containing protein [Bacillus andreraoultii]
MRFILIVLAVLLLFSFQQDQNQEHHSDSFFDKLQSGITEIKKTIDFDKIKEDIDQVVIDVTEKIEGNKVKENQTVNPDKIILEVPNKQTFSVANIEIGTAKQQVENKYGKAQRISLNEYNTNWYTYHEDYHNFFLVAYNKKDKVVGLFTNQNLVSSTNEVRIGSPKKEVLEKMGTPLSYIQKGFIRYKLPDDREYDLFYKDKNYITIFYDKHENNTVSAIQIISETLENEKTEIYANASTELMEGLELQLFDLTNAERVKHGLSTLSWDQHVQITARNHSDDMAKNAYFSHTNLDGQDPFQRMKEDNISFILAGENLAYGQFSSIFAHEGLLNSSGHRKNILEQDYEYLGIGVAFNDKAEPFYTQNFYAK